MTRLRIFQIAFVACLLGTWAAQVQADFTGLVNTGISGSPDPNWSVVSGPTGTGPYPAQAPVLTSPPSSYVPNAPGISQWISYPVGNQPNSSTPFVYQISFTGTSGTISGVWAADDNTSISVDGAVKVGFLTPTQDPFYGSFHAFSIALSGLSSGPHLLQFNVLNTNQGNPGATPEALNVRFATVVPEPSTIAMGIGAAGMFGLVKLARRRSSRVVDEPAQA